MSSRYEMIESNISELKYGDIFKFGKQAWDPLYRLESVNFYHDKKGQWLKEFEEECRICFHLLSPYHNNGFKGMFKWSDTNTIDQPVYIPKFLLCEWKKQKGKPCIPHGEHREIFTYRLNEINISDKYCNPKIQY